MTHIGLVFSFSKRNVHFSKLLNGWAWLRSLIFLWRFIRLLWIWRLSLFWFWSRCLFFRLNRLRFGLFLARSRIFRLYYGWWLSRFFRLSRFIFDNFYLFISFRCFGWLWSWLRRSCQSWLPIFSSLFFLFSHNNLRGILRIDLDKFLGCKKYQNKKNNDNAFQYSVVCCAFLGHIWMLLDISFFLGNLVTRLDRDGFIPTLVFGYFPHFKCLKFKIIKSINWYPIYPYRYNCQITEFMPHILLLHKFSLITLLSLLVLCTIQR